MNVIVTGASGLLGRAVCAEFKRNGWKVLGLAYSRVRDDLVKVDLRDINPVSKIIREFKPHAIIHCAAQKSPDLIQARPEEFFTLNIVVPGKLAKLAAEVKAVFVFISSDYVFDGENPPFSEDAWPNPLNAYGGHKLKAEKAVFAANRDSCILRIPVLYGGEERINESSISSLINFLLVDKPASVNNSEIRFPSHTRDIAMIIHELVQRKLQDESLKTIVFHWCGSEPFTKFQMTRMIAETFGRSADHLIPVDGPSLGARRPMNSQMSCERLINLGIQHHTRFVDGIQEFRKFF